MTTINRRVRLSPRPSVRKSAMPDNRGDDPIVNYRMNLRQHLFVSKTPGYYSAEAVITPSAASMPDSALFVGVTSHLLARYFHSIGHRSGA